MKLTITLQIEQTDLFFLRRRYGKQKGAARVIKQAIAEVASKEAVNFLKELENETLPTQRVFNPKGANVNE